MTERPASPSTPGTPEHEHAAPLWPVETDIYILPDGRVVIADLPAELASLAASLGVSDDLPIPTESSPL